MSAYGPNAEYLIMDFVLEQVIATWLHNVSDSLCIRMPSFLPVCPKHKIFPI